MHRSSEVALVGLLFVLGVGFSLGQHDPRQILLAKALFATGVGATVVLGVRWLARRLPRGEVPAGDR